ncbi:MAG: hypothetical protein ACTHJR_16500 [Sphingomonas sp.]|uniref:hypothetical protein n=1 Tax=Sphingomonas sp. TaxID=28214 RepID=UPI003F80B079
MDRSSRQRFGNNFAQAIVEDFAFRYADESYDEVVNKIQAQIKTDIQKELNYVAASFRRYIVGASGSSSGPGGTLGFQLGTELFDDMPIKAPLPEWAPRSAKYLSYKKRTVGHTRWFEYSGYTSRKMNGQNWQTMFGPIKVSFRKANHVERPGATQFRVEGQQGHMKVQVGTLRVEALTEITPAMLPALRTGDPMTPISATGNDALMGLVKRSDPELGYRLAKRSGQSTGMRYRPTLEPFLAFFLTRSVPNAVYERLQKGLTSARGSAGRTR